MNKGGVKKLYIKKKMMKIFILLSILVVAIIFLAIYILMPKLKLETDKVEVNVFDEYKDIKYSATNIGNDVTSDVKIDGIVDTSKVGEYKITYEYKNGIFDVKKYLIVKVVDNIPPDLSLIGDNEYKVCSLSSYIEPGYSALDNYDGDITSGVFTKYLEEDVIEYSVSDSSNNNTKVTRKLISEDKQGPELKLKGKETTYVTVNAKYEEQGATAKDNCDGDLTGAINIKGDIDTSKVGTYEIEYTVKDSSGNEASKKRKVVVQEKKEEPKQDSSDSNEQVTDGVIYLTFDDGPGSYTASILETLKKYDIKATFFVTSSGSDAIIKREADEGHTVALHTYTHDWNIYKSVATYLDDLNKIASRVKNITGNDAKYIRFPGGSSNQKIYHRSNNTITIKDLINAIEEKGYKYFDWNVSVEDAGSCATKNVGNKSDCVLRYFKNQIKGNRSNVVLLHDIKSYTASALESMIKYALGKGFTFKPIDDSTPICHFR